MGNQKPSIEEGQCNDNAKERGHWEKQRSTKHYTEN